MAADAPEALAEFPPSEETEKAWQWLEQHGRWAQGFWLVFMFTDSPPQAHILQERFDEFLRGRGQTQRVVRPETTTALSTAVADLGMDDGDTASCVWIECVRRSPLWLSDESEPWTTAWEQTLLRGNEQRERLRSRRQGVVIVMRSDLRDSVRRAAPDLWSVRDGTLQFNPTPCPSFGGAVLLFDRVRETSQDLLDKIDTVLEVGSKEGPLGSVSARRLAQISVRLHRALALCKYGEIDVAVGLLGAVRKQLYSGSPLPFGDRLISVVDTLEPSAMLLVGRCQDAEVRARAGLVNAASLHDSSLSAGLHAVLILIYSSLGREQEVRQIQRQRPPTV